MEQNEKLKILKQLSRSGSEKAASALEKEFASAAALLLENTEYYLLKKILEELSVYGHRVADDVISVLFVFLQRLQGSEFVTCDPDYAWSSPAKMQINLTNEALELVESFRYFNTAAVVEALVRYSDHTDENIAKTAMEGLKKCAAYDIRIFYTGEDRVGLGATPQLEIISLLEANQNEFASKYIQAVQILCAELLSSSMEGTSWDYQTVTWSSGAIPVCDATLEVRSRTISLLKNIYNADRSVAEKGSLIRALMVSTEVPRRSKYDDDLKAAIESDSLDILGWLETIIHNECFPVLQKVEHDVYWRYYHGISDEIRMSCLVIRDALSENDEYQIYRNLIGFESVFEDWEQSLTSERDFAQIEKERRQRASEYVQDITEENWAIWRDRIFEFCKTESNDMGTFPIFFEFLREFAELRPNFAYELVCDHVEKIEYFIIPIYRGLWRTKLRDECKALLMQRSSEELQLVAITKLFLGNEKADAELLENVLQSASETENEYVLSLLLTVAADNLSNDASFSIDGLFLPALERLKELGCKDWVQTIWYGQEVRDLVSELSEKHLRVLLDALVYIDRIEFQTEELLKPIAEKHPEMVLDFFRKRAGFEDRSDDYGAVPFELHGLREPLSKHPKLVIDVIRSWYEEDDVMFQYRGGMLIANIFPEFSDDLGQELTLLVQTGNEADAKFVLGILKNYHGQPFLHPVCQELVSAHFSNKNLMTKVYIVLISMGVVSGEYGMAEAYSQKAMEIEYWLNHEDENVRKFAKSHIETLKQEEKRERERAGESIELRKHQYGVTNDDKD